MTLFLGLPKQWTSLVGETAGNQSPYRPKAMALPNDVLDTSYVSRCNFNYHNKRENKKSEKTFSLTGCAK